MNKVIMVGTMARDPELKATASGSFVLPFSIRVYNSYKKESEFFECVAFGKTAETIAQYVQKGKGLCVEGSLDINEWTDKESGKTRRKYQVKVGSFTFLPKSNDQPATTTVDETGDIPF